MQLAALKAAPTKAEAAPAVKKPTRAKATADVDGAKADAPAKKSTRATKKDE